MERRGGGKERGAKERGKRRRGEGGKRGPHVECVWRKKCVES